ncbi:MAG: sigma factor-like helix-turn-helix DNA-binding protein [Tissierellia bacterium]|nr:sigma factor-like helix-turn-helix DNA-binding protein [Tissierellia bacterium]
MLERTLDNNERLAIYGSLLSERQRQVMIEYFWYDLSLNEIAEKMNISKQAVSDNIKRAELHLEEMENVLQLISKREHLREVVSKIFCQLDSLEKKLSPDDTIIVEKIKKSLKEVTL